MPLWELAACPSPGPGPLVPGLWKGAVPEPSPRCSRVHRGLRAPLAAQPGLPPPAEALGILCCHTCGWQGPCPSPSAVLTLSMLAQAGEGQAVPPVLVQAVLQQPTAPEERLTAGRARTNSSQPLLVTGECAGLSSRQRVLRNLISRLLEFVLSKPCGTEFPGSSTGADSLLNRQPSPAPGSGRSSHLAPIGEKDPAAPAPAPHEGMAGGDGQAPFCLCFTSSNYSENVSTLKHISVFLEVKSKILFALFESVMRKKIY